MATVCPSFLRGNAMRVTRLNGCGQPMYGDTCGQVVSDGFVTVTLSAEVEEGEEVTVTKANGQICISDKACDQLKWYTTEIEFCQVDPDLIQIMNPTWEKVLNANGDTVGWDAKGLLSCDTGFALEIWLDTYGATDICTGQEAQGSWGYLLLPWVIGGAPGDLEIGNDAISFTFNGRTKMGSRWGKGPYPVQLQENNAPGPLLTPITKDTQYRLFVTEIRPPEPECGCQPVDRPTPDPADLYIVGVATDINRRTIRLRPDNHGFGPVTIDWGDGTPIQESQDGRWNNHQYAEDGTYTVRVCDKQTPAVCAEREITIPLPADEPELVLACAGLETDPFAVKATVTFPQQSSGKGTIDWGDGTEVQELDASESAYTIEVPHSYTNAGIYTVTVRRGDQDEYRQRSAIQVPCTIGPEVTITEDGSDPTHMTALATWDNGDRGEVTIDWGDGTTAEDGPAAGTASHQFAAEGTYPVKICTKADPTQCTTTNVTVPFTATGNPVVTAAKDPADPTGMTVLLTIDNTGGGGGGGPQVDAARDAADPTGRTVQLTIDNTTTA